ncbi:hypothetical protein HDU92_005439 [Lobulomyces angularis]|nr:hypothetical protein HDU92_005439 [Lobulomyces angularis]
MSAITKDSINLIIGVAVSLASSMLASLGINLQASALVSFRERNRIAESESMDDDSDSGSSINGDDEESMFNVSQSGIHLRNNSTQSPEGKNLSPQRPYRISHNISFETLSNIPADSRINLEALSSSQMDKDQSSLMRESNTSQTGSEVMPNKIGCSFGKNCKLLFFKWQWYFGFFLYVFFQFFGSMIALNFIPPEVVAPLGATGLIFNMLFSKAFLGTSIVKKDWIGTLLIVLGCAIVSVAGSNNSGDNSKKKTIEEILSIYCKPQFIIYFVIQTMIILIMLLFVKYLEYGGPLKKCHEDECILYDESQNRASFNFSQEQLEELQDCICQETTENSPLLNNSHEKRKRHLRRKSSLSNLPKDRISKWIRKKRRSIKIVGLIGALYSVTGGISASDTLILASNGIDLLLYLFSGKEVKYVAYPIILLFCTVITVILQLYSLNRGLNFSLPTIVVPLFYTFYTVFSFTNSLIVISSESDKNNQNKLSGDVFWILSGLLLIVIGVWCLGTKVENSKGSENLKEEHSNKESDKNEISTEVDKNSNSQKNMLKSKIHRWSRMVVADENNEPQL